MGTLNNNGNTITRIYTTIYKFNNCNKLFGAHC